MKFYTMCKQNAGRKCCFCKFEEIEIIAFANSRGNGRNRNDLKKTIQIMQLFAQSNITLILDRFLSGNSRFCRQTNNVSNLGVD